MTETRPTVSAPPQKPAAERWTKRWLFPLLRILLLVFAAWLVWYVAGHWDRWTGAARFESTDDAFVSGDVTPLSARVSGNITEMPVNDFQIVRKGDLIAVIDPSDYQAQLELAQANLAAAQATLANLANQRIVQQSLVQQAEATIDATEADVLRYQLEDKRQRDLLRTGIAGTQQLVEQADDNAKRAIAQRRLNEAQLEQQKAALAAIDIQEKQLKAQIKAAEAQVALASDNLGYTRILSPADGLVGQRQVRLGVQRACRQRLDGQLLRLFGVGIGLVELARDQVAAGEPGERFQVLRRHAALRPIGLEDRLGQREVAM